MEEQLTLQDLMDKTAPDLNDPKLDYSPTNILLTLGSKVGRLQRFGKKKRAAAKGIGKDDAEAGLQKAKEEVGQALWLLAAFAKQNGFTLDEAFRAGHARQEKKRQQ